MEPRDRACWSSGFRLRCLAFGRSRSRHHDSQRAPTIKGRSLKGELQRQFGAAVQTPGLTPVARLFNWQFAVFKLERRRQRQVAQPERRSFAIYAEKLLPQPQLLTALGLLNVNPRFSRPS